MRRYRGSSLKIDWKDNELIALAEKVVDGVTEKAADLVVDYAKRNLRVNLAVDQARLVNQIDIRKSKFKHGGMVIVAQGPGNYGPKRSPKDNPYYASYIELGGHRKNGDHFEGRPYMRPAIKKVRRVFRKMMVEAMAGGQTLE